VSYAGSANYSAGTILVDITINKVKISVDENLVIYNPLFVNQPIDGTLVKTFIAMFNGTDITNDVVITAPEITASAIGDVEVTFTFTPNNSNLVETTVVKILNARLIIVNYLDATNNILQTNSIKFGDTVTYAGVNPTKTSTSQFRYDFTGWSDNGIDVKTDIDIKPIFAEITNSYNIMFHSNGQIFNTQTVEWGKSAGLIAVPELENKLFKGWYRVENSDSESNVFMYSQVIKEETHVYAYFIDIPAFLTGITYSPNTRLSSILFTGKDADKFVWNSPEEFLYATKENVAPTFHKVTYRYNNGVGMISKQIDVRVVVAKAEINLVGVVFEKQSFVYDGTTHSIVATGYDDKLVSVFYTNNDKTEVGTYVLTATFKTKDIDNYVLAEKVLTAIMEIRADKVVNKDTNGDITSSIESPNGIVPNADFISTEVNEILKFENINNFISSNVALTNYKITSFINLKLVKGDKEVKIDSTVTIRILITGDMKIKDTYKIALLKPQGVDGANNAADANTNIVILDATCDGNYIVFNTSELGDFAVLSDEGVVAPTSNNSLIIIIGASVGAIVLLGIIITIIVVRKKKRSK
ncbi:MAG: InlB B-repeat-containing protein, partial [Clostridia bacterium]